MTKDKRNRSVTTHKPYMDIWSMEKNSMPCLFQLLAIYNKIFFSLSI